MTYNKPTDFPKDSKEVLAIDENNRPVIAYITKDKDGNNHWNISRREGGRFKPKKWKEIQK